jgi:cell division protein FtsW (lipid II flippase)
LQPWLKNLVRRTVIIVSLLVFCDSSGAFERQGWQAYMFGALIAYGFGFLIFFQTAVNIGVN